MNRTELSTWVEYHDHLFSGFAAWWGQRHADAVEVWSSAMASISLESAKQASQDLIIGDVEATGGYTSHLKAIRARSRDIDTTGGYKPTSWSEGRQVFDCGLCADSGMVSIWHPIAVADAIDDKLIKLRTCGLPCSCRSGSRHLAGGWNGGKGQPTSATFAEGQHCEFLDTFTKTMRRAVIARVSGDNDGDKIRAIASVAERYHASKRTTAFDDWNNSPSEVGEF